MAALGYFVDVFDLLLSPIVRQASLADLGIPPGDAHVSATFVRATVATTVPNFVRGAVPLITGSFSFLLPSLGFIGSAWAVGLACIGLALVSLWGVAETAGRDLDFLE